MKLNAKSSLQPSDARAYLRREMELSALYRCVADAESDPAKASRYLRLATEELEHAREWAEKLGIDPASIRKSNLSFHLRLVWWASKLIGSEKAVLLPLLIRGEERAVAAYRAHPSLSELEDDARAHATELAELAGPAAFEGIRTGIGRSASASGSLRAAVLGINDGLVSNFSLVMGVAGGTNDSNIVLLAGVAGLFAGAFSMGAGEWVSMRSQRDMYEHLVRFEERLFDNYPALAFEQIVDIYVGKGIGKEQAENIAAQFMSSRTTALDTLSREKLGVDPDEIGSPWAAALGSILAFTVGAIFPVVPFIFTSGNAASIAAAAASTTALLIVGGIMAAFTGNSVVRGAFRMFVIGAIAAAVTFAVGSIVGVTLD